MPLATIVVLGETLYQSTLLLTKKKGLKFIASIVIIRKDKRKSKLNTISAEEREK